MPDLMCSVNNEALYFVVRQSDRATNSAVISTKRIDSNSANTFDHISFDELQRPCGRVLRMELVADEECSVRPVDCVRYLIAALTRLLPSISKTSPGRRIVSSNATFVGGEVLWAWPGLVRNVASLRPKVFSILMRPPRSCNVGTSDGYQQSR